MAIEIMEKIKADAILQSVECGLKAPLEISIQIEDWGFKVTAKEVTGRTRVATMTYQNDGSRSMYELDTKGR